MKYASCKSRQPIAILAAFGLCVSEKVETDYEGEECDEQDCVILLNPVFFFGHFPKLKISPL
jgi:hypothetical protein